MDGDFDGDEVFFYRITNKDAVYEIKKHLHANNSYRLQSRTLWFISQRLILKIT